MVQLELGVSRSKEPDRNHRHGGRSFYFFDLDDNVVFLPSQMYLFHKDSGKEKNLGTGEFAKLSESIGRSGPYQDYRIDFHPETGSYRRFRGEKAFLEDLVVALDCPLESWKGPSWNVFFHAVFNQRPISIITARGHPPDALKKGIEVFQKNGHLPTSPNYLCVFPVNHQETRNLLGDPNYKRGVPELKKQAIIHSVEEAMKAYGENPYHRFGMSDDDPSNLEVIVDAMRELKKTFPQNAFFVFNTQNKQILREEILKNDIKFSRVLHRKQLDLFTNSLG